MHSRALYFEDTYQFCAPVILLGCQQDEQGIYLLLNETPFYPQGGGQPSDQGWIEIDAIQVFIYKVKKINNEIRHYTDTECINLVGKKGLALIDKSKRLYHAKLHSAGHFISHIVERHYSDWQMIKGHHFPGEAYIEGKAIREIPEEININELNDKIQHYLLMDLPVYIVQNLEEENARTIQIGNFPKAFCGGTHIKNLSEIKGLTVSKIKVKKDLVKIYYQLLEE